MYKYGGSLKGACNFKERLCLAGEKKLLTVSGPFPFDMVYHN